MVDAYYDGPAGGFGDAIVVRESRAQRDGLFGGLVAVFVLAFIRGFAGARPGQDGSRSRSSRPPSSRCW
jgi:hypothetical protein